MRQQQQPTTLFHLVSELLRLIEGVGHRFIHRHVEALLQRQHSRSEVHIVGRDNGDKIHPLPFRQGCLTLHHLLVGGINPILRQKERSPCLQRFRRRRAETTTDQFNLSIQIGSHPVHRTDKRAGATTDHSHSDFSLHGIHCLKRIFHMIYS